MPSVSLGSEVRKRKIPSRPRCVPAITPRPGTIQIASSANRPRRAKPSFRANASKIWRTRALFSAAALDAPSPVTLARYRSGLAPGAPQSSPSVSVASGSAAGGASPLARLYALNRDERPAQSTASLMSPGSLADLSRRPRVLGSGALFRLRPPVELRGDSSESSISASDSSPEALPAPFRGGAAGAIGMVGNEG